jgi:RimJ/RimL family protein N-acetyltransferase
VKEKTQQKEGPRIVFRVGKRLYLRPISREDISQMTVWMNDPDTTRFLSMVHPMSLEGELKWFENTETNKGKNVIFAIVLKDSDEMIGVMGLHGIDHLHGIATTGSYIGKEEYRGKGYGTEAKMLVLEYAFNTLNLRKICSFVYDFNLRSKRCLEKCGYRVEGVLKKQHYRNGEYRDDVLLAIFKEDFFPVWEEYKKKNFA